MKAEERPAPFQLSVLEEPSEQLQARAEAVRIEGEPVHRPEQRHYYGDPSMRIPMDVFMSRDLDGTTRILIEAHTPAIVLPIRQLTHEVQHHIEMLNRALSIIVSSASQVPAPRVCRNCGLTHEECRTAPARGYRGGCCPECDHGQEAVN